MRVLYMGTPGLAARILEYLAPRFEVVGVVTRPDAVRGRGRALVGSPVKLKALELGLDVHTPVTLRDSAALELVKGLDPDVICVAAYGALLPREILDAPRYGCLNVHTSLLPRWRGAAPIERAILAHDEETGVSIMKMEEGLDTGPYCMQSSVTVGNQALAELEEALADEGARALAASIEALAEGSLTWTEQPNVGVTYADKVRKDELKLAPDASALDNVARVRASSEAHPARAVVASRPLTVLAAAPVVDEAGLGACAGLAPGEALYAMKRLFAQADDGAFEICAVKPDGKKAMDAKSFAAGIQGSKGQTIAWERAW